MEMLSFCCLCFSYHCKEVVIALDLRWDFGELLVEGIGDVVSRVGGDDENALPDCSELDGQTTAGKKEKKNHRSMYGCNLINTST